MSYAKSANYAFAQIGDQMDPDIFINYATRFGFSNPQPFSLEIESSPAQLAINPDALRSDSLLRASTAIGQGEALASPLEMGMLVLSVLNNGDLPLPYFVQSIQSPAGKPMNMDRNRQILRGLMRPETAREVRDMMVSVVQRGSGTRAAIQGVQVGGKTGTAQVGGSQAAHAWFTGFAEKDGHSVVVVVLIENGGEGGSTAAPIFASIARLALKNNGVSDMPDASLETQPTQEPACQEADGVLCPDVLRDPLKVELDQTSIPGTCHIDHEGPVGSGVFEWPTDAHGVVGSDFTTDHPAVDLGAQADTPVKAADAGLVVFAGWTDVGYGNAIVINHGNGYRTLYAHLGKLLVRCGQDVKSGQTIGLAGDTGFTGGPHLHFEIRVQDGFINPWKLLPTGD
jgi:hypothetical protein